MMFMFIDLTLDGCSGPSACPGRVDEVDISKLRKGACVGMSQGHRRLMSQRDVAVEVGEVEAVVEGERRRG